MSRRGLVLALLLAIAVRGLAQDVDPAPVVDPTPEIDPEGVGLDLPPGYIDPEDLPGEGVGLDITDESINSAGFQTVKRPPPPGTLQDPACVLRCPNRFESPWYVLGCGSRGAGFVEEAIEAKASGSIQRFSHVSAPSVHRSDSRGCSLLFVRDVAH